jgi:hypothetical protein
MLTNDRPGVFWGESFNHGRWFVADPAEPNDQAQLWKDRFSDTNVSDTRRTLAFLAGWTSFLVLFGAALLGAALLAKTIVIVAILLPLIAFPVAVVIGALAHGAITHVDYKRVREPLEFAVEVRPVVAAWATDETPPEVLWKVNSVVQRMILLAEASESMQTRHLLWDEICARSPSLGAIRHELHEALAATRSELDDIAEEYDFQFEQADIDPELGDDY